MKKHYKINFNQKIISLFFVLIFSITLTNIASAQPPSAYISVTDGDLETAATWDVNASPSCSIKKDVTITNGDSVFTTCSPLETTATGSLTVTGLSDLHIIGSAGLTGAGDINVAPNSSLRVDGDFKVTGNGDLIINGNLKVGGDVVVSGSGAFYGDGDVIIDGTGCQYWEGPGTCNDSNTPLALLELYAKSKVFENNLTISWELNSNKAVNYFTIERSKYGKLFEEIAKINSSENEFLDVSPNIGDNYYRVKQVEMDGKSSYSNVIYQKFSLNNEIVLYPNPSNGVFYLTFPENTTNTSTNISVFDNQGRLVLDKNVTEFENKLTLNENNALTQGVYYLKIQSNTLNNIQKFTINKF